MRLVGSALLSLRQSTRRASFRGGAVAAKRQALASSASAKKRLIAACAPFLYCYCSLAATTSAAFAAAPHAAMSFSTERSGDGTITVAPRNEADQSALMVICHGLGDTAEGFADVAEFLGKTMPYIKFILPTAPTQPVTMNMGMSMPSWYDITGLDERANENCKGLEDSVERLRGILQTEHETTGLPYERMVLAGFSQGGGLSLFTGLGLPRPLAGIAVLSGYLPAAGKFQLTPGLEGTPILHCHGTQDPLVDFSLAHKTKDRIQDRGVRNYTVRPYPIGHTVSTEELADVLQFVQGVLPDDPSHKIKLKDPGEMSVKELRAAIRKAGLSHKAVGFCEKAEFVGLLQNHRDGKL